MSRRQNRNYTPYKLESYSVEKYLKFFSAFLEEHHTSEIECILFAADISQHYGLVTKSDTI